MFFVGNGYIIHAMQGTFLIYIYALLALCPESSLPCKFVFAHSIDSIQHIGSCVRIVELGEFVCKWATPRTSVDLANADYRAASPTPPYTLPTAPSNALNNTKLHKKRFS